jgi:hypothetical protein
LAQKVCARAASMSAAATISTRFDVTALAALSALMWALEISPAPMIAAR